MICLQTYGEYKFFKPSDEHDLLGIFIISNTGYIHVIEEAETSTARPLQDVGIWETNVIKSSNSYKGQHTLSLLRSIARPLRNTTAVMGNLFKSGVFSNTKV